MKGGPPATLGAGAYAYLPSRHAHGFACPGACLLFISQDAAFDIHYVDGAGQEISLDQALKGIEGSRP